MCRVMAVDEISAYVQLLEYNVEGMVLISELSRRRMRSVQKHIKVGQTKVLVVIRVDADKGDLPSYSPLHSLAGCYLLCPLQFLTMGQS